MTKNETFKLKNIKNQPISRFYHRFVSVYFKRAEEKLRKTGCYNGLDKCFLANGDLLRLRNS